MKHVGDVAVRRTIGFGALAATATVGVLAALMFAAPAAAYTADQLPGLGYSVSVTHLGNGCSTWLAGYGNAAKTDLGNDCDSGFQGRLDAFVQATCPCAQPATTTTTPAPAPAPAPTTTTTATPSPAPAPVTTVVTTTTTTATDPATSAVVSDLQARVALLETQLVDLQKRVDVLVSGQTVTLASRAWTVSSAKNGLATLVAKVRRPGEKTRPHRKVPSAVLVPLIAKH